MLSAREELDVKNAFGEVGTYRGAAQMCGVDPKTVKRAVLRDQGCGRSGRGGGVTTTGSAAWWLTGSS